MTTEEMIKRNAKFGIDKNGVHFCVLPFGAGALEGFGNSRDEAAAYVAEQYDCETEQENTAGLFKIVRDGIEPVEANDTQIVGFLIVCAQALAIREDKTLLDLWADVYKAAEAVGANG